MSALSQTEPQTGTRLAVLWVPDWPVGAAISEGLAGAHEPVAVHDNRQIVVADAQARRMGVRRGMRRRTAQGICPELVLIAADEGRDVRAFESVVQAAEEVGAQLQVIDRKSTRLNSSHVANSYAVFCLIKKKLCTTQIRRIV